jgi:hypothetical protein
MRKTTILMRKTTILLLGSLFFLTTACGDSDGDMESFLFVQSADGGTLTDSVLLLSGVSETTVWFSDRPERRAGQTSTASFIESWGDGTDSFTGDPPNADFTCEVNGETVNRVVTLLDPILEGDDLSYATTIVPSVSGENDSGDITCDGASHLFLDSQGYSSILRYSTTTTHQRAGRVAE